MSHLRTSQTSIRNPSVDLLKAVTSHIASTEPGGRVATAARDYYNSPTPSDCGLALFTEALQRGFAINVKSGTLTYEGDNYDAENAYERVTGRVTGEYIDSKFAAAFADAGYVMSDVKANDKDGRTMTFVGPGSTTVVITRDRDGNVEWDFDGFDGKACFDIQALVEQYLLQNHGIEVKTTSVREKRDERWLEERIPSQEQE